MDHPVQSVVQQGKAAQAAAASIQSGAPETIPPWSPALRASFRFCFVYFALYSFSNGIIRILLTGPYRGVPALGDHWPLAPLTMWTAKHVFRISHPLMYAPAGGGDKTFGWVQNFCILVIALVAGAIWSFLDRRRKQYVSLHKWLHLFLRLALASVLISYGANKFFPVQMGFPSLSRLLEPYGNLSLRAVLWSSVGASPVYEIFTGSSELLAGVLLLLPRTATFGALLALADMIQVFMLNMTYDVMVKRFSFHLILYSLFLLAPEMRRLVTFFFTDRQTSPSKMRPLFRSARAIQIAVAAQTVFGVYLLCVNLYPNAQSWKFVRPGRPKPPLYGIWNVERMWVDGVERPPLLTDYDRWRRVIFDSVFVMQFQRMDDTFGGYQSETDEKTRKITLSKFNERDLNDNERIGEFIFNRPAGDRLVFDGTLGGHKTTMELTLVDRDRFRLIRSGFHWINEDKPVVHFTNSLD